MNIYKLTKISDGEETFSRLYIKVKDAKESARRNHRLHQKRGCGPLTWANKKPLPYTQSPIYVSILGLNHIYIIEKVKLHGKATKR